MADMAKCLNCGHEFTSKTEGLVKCPKCGAIYRRTEGIDISTSVAPPSKPKKHSKALGCLLMFVLITVFSFLVLFGPYLGREKAADTIIESMKPLLKVGMSRDNVTSILEANGFEINTTSPPKKDPEHRQIYVKAAGTSMFSWIRYDVFIEYNENGLLKFARFLKSHHEDGQDTSCFIIFEIPVEKDKKYPIPCPKNIQDF
jgi:predicted  nucleic acid-binding Zn-ribbon protein